MTQAAAAGQDANTEAHNATFTRMQFWALIGQSVIAYFATGLLIRFVGYFYEPGFNASILLDPRRTTLIAITLAWMVIVGAVATYVARWIRPDAGLFVAACAAWSFRRSGGMARDVYLAHPTASALQLLAVELVLLGLVVAAVYLIARRMVAAGVVPDDAELDRIRPNREPLGQRLLATATQALVMMVLMLLTVKSDERMQVTGMVFACAMLASMSTVRFIPATPSIYFWAGPLLVGVAGYLASSFRGTANLPIGDVSGYFGALTRAMPLDYASAGIAGALYGYWSGRGWIPEDALEPEKK